ERGGIGGGSGGPGCSRGACSARSGGTPPYGPPALRLLRLLSPAPSPSPPAALGLVRVLFTAPASPPQPTLLGLVPLLQRPLAAAPQLLWLLPLSTDLFPDVRADLCAELRAHLRDNPGRRPAAASAAAARTCSAASGEARGSGLSRQNHGRMAQGAEEFGRRCPRAGGQRAGVLRGEG